MAGSLSNYAEIELLKWIVGQDGAMGSGLTRYLAAFTAFSSEGDTKTEVTDANNYSRVDISSLFAAPSAGAVTNDEDVAFPVASGDQGEITHVAIMDSATHGAGNVIAWTDITTADIDASGKQLRFPAGELDFTAA